MISKGQPGNGLPLSAVFFPVDVPQKQAFIAHLRMTLAVTWSKKA
ncbi:hypothetical protein [Aquamicrobium sp.]|nr:hypothetical protein [Aquamicrobium sp.]